MQRKTRYEKRGDAQQREKRTVARRMSGYEVGGGWAGGAVRAESCDEMVFHAAQMLQVAVMQAN